jgi:hypothetical protein
MKPDKSGVERTLLSQLPGIALVFVNLGFDGFTLAKQVRPVQVLRALLCASFLPCPRCRRDAGVAEQVVQHATHLTKRVLVLPQPLGDAVPWNLLRRRLLHRWAQLVPCTATQSDCADSVRAPGV